MNTSTTRRRTAVAALGIAVAGALTACGDSGDSGDGGDGGDGTAAGEAPTATVTETVTADPGAPETTSGRPTQDGTAGGVGVTSLVFDGADLASQFTDVQCRQDGADEFEIDLWTGDRADHVEVDLDLRDQPRVDGLGVDREGKEWESTDTQERDATVQVDGDTYRVTGQLEVDDDHPDAGDVADLELEVSCA